MSETSLDETPQEAAPALLEVVHQPLPHDSALRHVQGNAPYIDDILEPEGTLHLAIGMAPIAAGEILSMDLSAVRQAPGIVAVLTAEDIRGRNDVSPALGDEPMLAAREISFHGQPVFLVAATSRKAARVASRLARFETRAEAPVVTVTDARQAGGTVLPDYAWQRGDADAALAEAPHRLEGELEIGGQEHFYLEGQIAFAIPGEDGDMFVHSSTQHPSEVQHIVARVMGRADHAVTVECRRMGGGFGGKESQASHWAALAAFAAQVTGRPCKLRLDRDDDFALTGKRHDFLSAYAVGFDDEGRLQALDIRHDARCGYSADLSLGVIDRTMFHTDNAYFIPASRIASRRLKTNTVSNTAFRGFGGPQGMLAIEAIMDGIARRLGRDALDVRKDNLYRPGHLVTPYGMEVFDHATMLPLIETLEASSRYRERRREVAAFNAHSPILKRGLALTPVKFGISFTLKHLNQAGALVHVYSDGSVMLNHGGTEMGQGLFVKVAQVVADEFGLPLDRVKITATNTAKVPNTGPTAASSGSDLNAMAARIAARTIRDRMAGEAARRLGDRPDRVQFRHGRVFAGEASMSFAELAKACVLERIALSSTGYYRTPGITWDRTTKTGRPFFYFAYGAACSEVLIDTTTGEMRLEAVDILHDCGRSLNPAIDIGQIEGGFVQGLGWLTTEELVFDREGRLRTHAPSTYKIPVASDVPAHFRVDLWHEDNREDSIYRSKAVGEPPVMLAISVFSAIADAIHAVKPGHPTQLRAPATPEAILDAIDRQWSQG
ncbi:MAG: xanthine dehydrogenase molybdopterin binding subunit [Beijerinckiaceae bacterium]|nr:xanthine dehydrogenase molybdopterin binding subunit [Beijerinckiaceae bacterium]MCZ8300991.1 xanthine dehydrogenase molybdopterin binding subunit [Beijerinckiaceae bacterium]